MCLLMAFSELKQRALIEPRLDKHRQVSRYSVSSSLLIRLLRLYRNFLNSVLSVYHSLQWYGIYYFLERNKYIPLGASITLLLVMEQVSLNLQYWEKFTRLWEVHYDTQLQWITFEMLQTVTHSAVRSELWHTVTENKMCKVTSLLHSDVRLVLWHTVKVNNICMVTSL